MGEQERKSLERVFWRWALSPFGQAVLEGLFDEAIAFEKEQAPRVGGLKTDGRSWFPKPR